MDGIHIVIVIVIIIIVISVGSGYKKQQEISKAKARYKKSLEMLKQNPQDVGWRQTTLKTGRAYARAVRDGGKETIFDEVALMNDINAITSLPSQATQETKTHVPSTIEQRLSKLADLKKKNLITEEEHENRKLAILNEI